MASLLIILVGCWVFCGATVRKNDTYVDTGLNNKLFTDDITFETTARSELECSLICSQQSCVTFTFHNNTCRGHSAPMRFCSLHTSAPGARSFTIESKAKDGTDKYKVLLVQCNKMAKVTVVKKEVKRLTNVSLGLDMDVYYENDWLVFQKRQDGSVDFYRYWADYVNGFGDVHGEFWLGLEPLHRITTSGEDYELRVELMTWDGTRGCASYSKFSVGPASDKYRLSFDSFLGGDAGDSLGDNRDMQFSTKDSDNDIRGNIHCATNIQGAWWYNKCGRSNLNGIHRSGETSDSQSVTWFHFTGNRYLPLKTCQMMTKPKH